MNPEWTILTCTFPDRETALVIARALGGNAELDRFPDAGYLDGYRYDIGEIGLVYTPVTAWDEAGNPTDGGELVSGWHMIGVWRGPPESVPAAIMDYQIDRSNDPTWPQWG